MASLGSFKKGIVYTKGGLGQTGISLPSGAAPVPTHLLDIYSGAAAAYSVFKLSSTATNSLRVRRSSDNAEQDIGFVGDTLDTAALEAFTNSIFENALEFDGVDDYVSIGSPVSMSSEATVNMWVKFSDLNTRIISDSSNTAVIWTPTSTSVRVYCGGNFQDFVVPTMSLGTWYMLTATRDAANGWRVYLNGTESTSGLQVRSGTFNVNRLGNLGSVYSDIVLDEVSILEGTTASDIQIASLYNSGNGADANAVLGSTSLYYRLNESGTDTTAVDASGNSNNGTLNNFPASGMWVSHPGGNYDAFVTTYYDQSGNSSNFTQTSASNQPKIVSAGVVVTSGSVPAVKFDGIGYYLSNTVDLFGEARLDQFFLTDTDGDTAYIFPNSNITSYYGMIAYSGNTSTVTTSPSYGSPSLYQNGVPINVTNRNTVYNDTNGRKVISHIAPTTSIWAEYRFGFWSPGFLNFGGKLSALVAYTSDQSANRVGIETILDSLYNP